MARPKKPVAPPAWERRPGESDVAYEAFIEYRDLGPKRSVRVAAANLQKTSRTLNDWRGQHEWLERARLWDNHVQKMKDRGAAKFNEKVAVDWLKRRDALMVRDFETSHKLFEKTRKIIESVDLDKTGVGGQSTDTQMGALKIAAAILKEMSAMGWAVVNAGVGDMTPAPQGPAVGQGASQGSEDGVAGEPGEPASDDVSGAEQPTS